MIVYGSLGFRDHTFLLYSSDIPYRTCLVLFPARTLVYDFINNLCFFHLFLATSLQCRHFCKFLVLYHLPSFSTSFQDQFIWFILWLHFSSCCAFEQLEIFTQHAPMLVKPSNNGAPNFSSIHSRLINSIEKPQSTAIRDDSVQDFKSPVPFPIPCSHQLHHVREPLGSSSIPYPAKIRQLSCWIH